MSPRVKKFNPNSIIYFEGDKSDSVFLLKSGKINLVYNDLATKEKIIDLISPGEFFGVKSGLIKYPREETAQAVTNSVIFEFPASEFEALLMKNTQIILKILKVFSNQLRKVGKQIQSIVSNKISNDPSDEFFQIGEYYLKNRKFKQAFTVYKRYLNYYPTGKFANAAAKRLENVKSSLDTMGGGESSELDDSEEGSSLSEDDMSNFQNSQSTNSQDEDLNFDDNNLLNEDNFQEKDTNEDDFSDFEDFEDFEEDNFEEDDLTNIDLKKNVDEEINLENVSSNESKLYYKGVSLMNTGKYLDAFNIFKNVLTLKNENVKILASYEIGKCFYFLNKYDECINHLTKFLSKHSGFHERLEVLFYIGSSYLKNDKKTKALKVFKNILSNTDQKDPIYRKTKRLLEEVK